MGNNKKITGNRFIFGSSMYQILSPLKDGKVKVQKIISCYPRAWPHEEERPIFQMTWPPETHKGLIYFKLLPNEKTAINKTKSAQT
jgi:hypothetical protein